jgi:myosin heavy subunit
MVKMPILNEPEIINNIFVRFRRDEIYSYIGLTSSYLPLGPTLLCMNPYKSLKIFETSIMQKV